MKKINKYLFLLVLTMTIPISSSHAQQAINLIQTPNTASLGAFEHIPVSLFTGVPQINIPLFDVREKDVSVPISIDYHTSMIKPNNHPGWVGLGWNLTAGGAITRIPNGRRDEDKGHSGGSGHLTYNENYTLLNDNWLSNSYWIDRDYQPDEFVFNFGKYSGSFFKKNNGEWQVRSSEGTYLKVTGSIRNEFSINTSVVVQGTVMPNYPMHYRQSYYSFTITAEDGTVYVFGGTDNSIEGNGDMTLGNEVTVSGIILPGYIDTWLLQKIITPEKQEIIFDYERKGVISTQTTSFSTMSYHIDYNYGPNIPWYLAMLGVGWSSYYGTVTAASGGKKEFVNFITPVYLKSISSDKCSINFFLSGSNQLAYPSFTATPTVYFDSEYKKLDSIQIKNKNEETVKRFVFNYTNNNTERLKLLSLKEYGNLNDNIGRTYSFEYNPGKMPAYRTTMVDHWGYYNGINYLTSGNAGRRSEVNEPLLKAEILEKIIYPTGGRTILEYEPHEFTRYITRPELTVSAYNNAQTIGGLRIKEIRFLDSNQALLKKNEYKYVMNYENGGNTSSGILAGIPTYSDGFEAEYRNGKNYIKYVFLFSDKQPFPLNYTSGSHITYSEVVEKTSGNGYTVHSFTNFDTSPMYLDRKSLNNSDFLTYKDCQYSSLSYTRGKPLTDKIYNESGVLISKIENEYNLDESVFVRSVLTSAYNTLGSVKPYKIFTGTHTLNRQRDSTYNSANANIITTEKTFSYNSKNLLSETCITNSNASVFKQEMKYSSDFQISPYPAMVTKNILSPVVETYNYINNNLTEKTAQDYALQHSLFYAPVNSKYQKGYGSLEVRETYQYDTKGNVREVVKNDSDKTVYLWSYNYQYPIAKIENATYAEVETAAKNVFSVSSMDVLSAQTTPNETLLQNGSLQDALPNAQVTTYIYKPLIGIKTVTDPRKVKITYEYDAFGRLQHIKDHTGNTIESYNYHYKNQ